MAIAPPVNVMLGDANPDPRASGQYGIIGVTADERRRIVATDLNLSHTILYLGLQNSGKSYNSDSMLEMAVMDIPGINLLPDKLAACTFHYSPTPEYRPEGASMVLPNTVPRDVKILMEAYKASPAGVSQINIIVPEDEVAARTIEFAGLPNVHIHPLLINLDEIGATHLKLLMGAVGPTTYYLRVLLQILRANRHKRDLKAIRADIEMAPLSDADKLTARGHLDLAETYIRDNGPRIGDLIRPGVVTIVDIRDEFMSKEDALILIQVLFQIFCSVTEYEGKKFKRIFKFDEFHKYTDTNSPLVGALCEAVREMRHKGIFIEFASQDPSSIPIDFVKLSDIVHLHKFSSILDLLHLASGNDAFSALKVSDVSTLIKGQGLAWASNASEPAFTRAPIKLDYRPRATLHGGATITSVPPSH